MNHYMFFLHGKIRTAHADSVENLLRLFPKAKAISRFVLEDAITLIERECFCGGVEEE